VTGGTGVDILNLNTGLKTGYVDVSPFGSINSVDIYNGVAAFAIENEVRSNDGFVQFYDTSSQSLIKKVSVGALPDMVKFTANGSKLLVANEGTPDQYGAEIGSSSPKKFAPAVNDPTGSVSIIDTSSSDIKDAKVIATAGFEGVAQTGSHIRTDTGMDFEPEYIAINEKGTKAYVSLQEANAVGVLDLGTNEFEKVLV
jgi:DNA-binding beta-propeller fold protein YncE